MTVETATYISDLNATYPVPTDPIPEGDDHIRLVKSVLKATFPNTTGPVTAPQADLNAAALAFHNAGTVDVAANGTTSSAQAALRGVTGSGDMVWLNQGTAGVAAGARLRLFDATNANPLDVLTADYAGHVNALVALNSPSLLQNSVPLVPAGVIVMWSGSIASIPAGWVLCNGANGTPDLRDRFIYGAGGLTGPGGTGGALAQTATASSAGGHSHTTAAAGGVTLTASSDVQGSHSHTGSTAGHTLTLSEIPSHDHGLGPSNGQIVAYPGVNTNLDAQTGSKMGGVTPHADGADQPHVHGISTDGAHSHNIAVSAVPDHTHVVSSVADHTHTLTVPTVPPFFALAFIMKS